LILSPSTRWEDDGQLDVPAALLPWKEPPHPVNGRLAGPTAGVGDLGKKIPSCT
jgi:hypothetical protein